MESKKVSRKALASLLNDSLREAIGHLQLPKPTKKVKKLIDRSSRKLASEFADLIRKQNKKQRKAEAESESHNYVDSVLKGKKDKKSRKVVLESFEEVK